MKKFMKKLALVIAIAVAITSAPVQKLQVSVYASYGQTFRLTISPYIFNLFEDEKTVIKARVEPNEGQTLPELRYEWKKYVNHGTYSSLEKIEGANTNEIEVDGSENTSYYCYAYDVSNPENCAYDWGVVNTKSNVILSSKKNEIRVAYGDIASMKVEATTHKAGTSIVSYKWYKGKRGEATLIKDATAANCKVTANSAYENYFCEVEDSVGDSNYFSFVVKANSGLKITQSNKSYNVIEGGSITMSADAIVKDADTVVEYQWKKLDKARSIYRSISGATESTYTASGLQKGDMFRCEVKATRNGHVQEEVVSVSIYVTPYGINLSQIPYLVKAGTTINFNASSQSGTLQAELVKNIWGTNEVCVLTGENGQYSCTITDRGLYRIKAFVDKNISGGCVYTDFYVFSESTPLVSGQEYTLNKEAKDENGYTIYDVYSFVPEQTGEYSFISDDIYSLSIVEEGQMTTTYVSSDKMPDNSELRECKCMLEKGKTYYIRNTRYSGASDTYKYTIVNKVFCDHDNTKIINAKAATCTENGYTGDTICKDCECVIIIGNEIPATGHNIAVVNARPATLTEDGYTGDKVCTVCNTTVEAGAPIARINSVKFKNATLSYTGKNVKPKVIVKDSAGNTIPESCYSVKYPKNSKTIGKKTAVVTFKGNYSGTKKLTYKIAPKNTSKLTVKAGKRSINVSWKKQATQTTGYQIQYSAKKNFKGAKTVTIKNNKTTKTTIKSLKKETTYYVRIRTYKTVSKKNIYSDWSGIRRVKVTK